MKSSLFCLSLCVVLGAFTLNTAVAGDTEDKFVTTGHITVSYGDLNLASNDGLDVLYMRIKSAADKVCGVEKLKVSLDIVRLNRACVAGAVGGAISDVNDVRLTQFHQAKLAEARQS